MKKLLGWIVVLAWLVPASSWAVTVSFQPSNSVVALGDNFTVDILADILDTEAVLGWGLDVGFDSTILSLSASPTLGSLWQPTTSNDGDGLVGLAFPDPISGTNVLLASLSFSADALGTSDLLASVTAGDLTEGFPLATSGFADVTFNLGSVTVIPLPAAALVFISGLLGLLGIARHNKRA